jgi:hypothetical protein
LFVAQKRLHPCNEARCHDMRLTLPCRASLHRKAVRLQKLAEIYDKTATLYMKSLIAGLE